MSRRAFRMVRCPLLVLAIVACGGPGTEPVRPRDGTAQPPRDPSPLPADAITARECEQLAVHAVAIHVAALRATHAADRLPTEAEQAGLVAELRGDPACRRLTRAAYRCALAATTLDELAGCGASRAGAIRPRTAGSRPAG